MMRHLARCPGEGATCLEFDGGRAQLCFPNTRVPVGKMFHLQSVRVAQTPCEQFPLNKKNDEHGFHSWFAHSGLLWSRWLGSVPLWTLSLGCGIVLENPSLISGYHCCRKSVSLVTLSKIYRQTNTRLSFCSSDKFFGTSFTYVNTESLRWKRRDEALGWVAGGCGWGSRSALVLALMSIKVPSAISSDHGPRCANPVQSAQNNQCAWVYRPTDALYDRTSRAVCLTAGSLQ